MSFINPKIGAFFGFCTVLISVVCLWPHDTLIVTFNAAEVRGKFIRQLAEHAAADEQVAKASVAFKYRLNAALTEYAKAHHVVIVDSNTVLAGSKDITTELLLLLSHGKRGKP